MSCVDVAGRCKKDYKILARNVADKVIELMEFPDKLEVSIEFVSEDEILYLNSTFRKINKMTDVLSFPSFSIETGKILNLDSEDVIPFIQDNGFVHFGDMAICLSQTKRQAKEFGVSVESEIKKLVIHSMLHLMGYDHIKDEDYEIMKPVEEMLDKKIIL